MKKSTILKGSVIVIITLSLLALLYFNYMSKLDNIFDNTKIVCNEDKNNCEEDLKRNVILSKDAKNTIIYTSILTLIVLNASAFTLYYTCFNKKGKSNKKK